MLEVVGGLEESKKQEPSPRPSPFRRAGREREADMLTPEAA